MAIPRSLRVWRTRRWGVLTAVLALLAGALAGCAVGPDYKRPEVSAPAEWRSPSEGPGSLTDLGWWELFQDPMLPGLVRTAVEENKDVQVAVARVAEARAQLGIARAARFPQVDGPARPKPWDLATRARRAEIGSRCKSWTVDASYTGSWAGITEVIERILEACGKDPAACVLAEDPARLIDRLIHYYRTEHHRKPSCFCESKEG